jgi:hypothetical protein
MKPPRSLLDPTFRYTPAAATDLRKTFARIRREQRKAAQAQQPQRVIPIKRVQA